MAGITSTKKIKGQPHFLAYITPSEAKTLENLGGQKTMTKEGVPAYPPGEKYGGTDESGNFNDPTPSSPSGKSSNNKSNNNGGQSIQDYYDDYTNLSNTEVITDKDRDDFFKAKPDYKTAADNAAKAKAKQKEEARKEKERIDKILETQNIAANTQNTQLKNIAQVFLAQAYAAGEEEGAEGDMNPEEDFRAATEDSPSRKLKRS